MLSVGKIYDIEDVVKFEFIPHDENQNELLNEVDKNLISEQKMLLVFARILKLADPDFIIGYNCHEFDLRYILHRIKQLPFTASDRALAL